MKKTIGLIALTTCLSAPVMVHADSSLKPSIIPAFDSKSQQISNPLADVPHIIVAGRGNGGGGNGGGGGGRGNGGGGSGGGNGGGGTGSGTGGGTCDGSGPSS